VFNAVCIQRSAVGKNQLFCAILTADSVSWFQLHNATSAKPVESLVICNGGDAAAHNDLLDLDSKYLDTTFTKLYLESTVKLRVYGARLSTPGEAQTDFGPSQPFKAAIADAIHTAADDLCSSSTVLLAKAPSGGTDYAIVAQRPKLQDSCDTPCYLCKTHVTHMPCLHICLAPVLSVHLSCLGTLIRAKCGISCVQIRQVTLTKQCVETLCIVLIYANSFLSLYH